MTNIPQTCSNCKNFRDHEEYKSQIHGDVTNQMLEVWKQLGQCIKKHKPLEIDYAIHCNDFIIQNSPSIDRHTANYSYIRPEILP
jgi:hypothetical protein